MIFRSGLLGATVSGLFEGLGIPWPGTLVLTAAGANGTGMQGALWLGTLFAVTYTVGAMALYALGRWGWVFFERWVPKSTQDRLERAIKRYGHGAVCWIRPLAIGNYISIPAGMMRMNPIKFIIYTFAGIWPWAFAILLMGEVVNRYLAQAMPYLLGILLVVAVAPGLRRLWQRFRQA